MKHNEERRVREPLIHLTRRGSIRPLQAWGIRIAAAALGLLLACAGLDWVRARLFRALRVRERAEALLRPLTERLNDTKE